MDRAARAAAAGRAYDDFLEEEVAAGIETPSRWKIEKLVRECASTFGESMTSCAEFDVH